MNAVSFEFWVKLFKLPKEDNLHIQVKARTSAPNLSVIRRFYVLYWITLILQSNMYKM